MRLRQGAQPGGGFAMVRIRHYVGPPWPPKLIAYDYVLTLWWSDFAWEYLRRDPAYQRDYQLGCRGIAPPRRLRNGLILTQVRGRSPHSLKWNLSPFCRSGAAGAACTPVLDRRGRRPEPRGGRRACR
jgi:hypothetical protein